MKKTLVIREEKGDTLLDHLLFHRGIVTSSDRDFFLNPDYAKIHDPYLLADMKKAVNRIEKAIDEGEKITVYSDFDADGIPGAVVMSDYFREIGYTNVAHYIPHRHDEGFGLHKEALDIIKAGGTTLIITVDCGIADIQEAKYCKELGMDLIITDHHLTPEFLPDAFAIIDPKRSDCSYPEKMLCGAGLAFKLVQALLQNNRRGVKDGKEKWMLDMVGLATLSDMVPLLGENRIFATYGLRVLQKSRRPGIIKLLVSLKMRQQDLTEDDVAFMITPRINVASRMGNPYDAFRLLSTTDEDEVDALVESLNLLNSDRKVSVAGIVKAIKNKIEKRGLDDKAVIVLGDPEWKPALLGLVATSLVREYNKPVFLWGRVDDETLKGSCRSEGVTDIVALMNECSDIIIEGGGHAMAGGYSVSNEKIHLLDEGLNLAYKKIYGVNEEKVSEIVVDRKLGVDEVNWQTYKNIEVLAPFGSGNSKPLFVFENVIPKDVKNFGKTGDHMEISFVNQAGKKLSAIQFFASNRPPSDMPLTFTAHLEKSMFRNFPELRLRIVDILN